MGWWFNLLKRSDNSTDTDASTGAAGNQNSGSQSEFGMQRDPGKKSAIADVIVDADLTNFEHQKRVVLDLKRTFSPQELEGIGKDIAAAESAFSRGEKASGMVISSLARALNNKVVKDKLGTVAGAALEAGGKGALAISGGVDVPGLSHFTRGVSHGLIVTMPSFSSRGSSFPMGFAA